MAMTSVEPRLQPGKLLSTTESVCPECLRRLPARRIERDGVITLQKTCPEHGTFETVIWRENPAYETWNQPKVPAFPEQPATSVRDGCPFDCGLCPEHRQQPCCVLLEVTQRCDLGCPVCYASAGEAASPDPDLRTIESWYRKLMKAGGPFNIQLSGGEPSLRADLPAIIRLGRALGFSFFQLNTNGLRIARDLAYLMQLKEAGLSVVYLQFDGVDDLVYRRIRGKDLLEQKIAAIQNCIDLQLGVILVPTIVPGINDHEIGAILKFALEYSPGVRGVHYQPISYFGRYLSPPTDEQRITLPEIITALEKQTGGLVKTANFKPSGGPNPRCSFQGNFVVMPDGKLSPITRFDPQSCCCAPKDARAERLKAQSFVAKNWAVPHFSPQKAIPGPSLGEWDVLLERSKTHLLAVSGMAFQDAWTLDLERLKGCYIMTVAPDGRLIPFCAYNLTRRDGTGLYRQQQST